MHVTLGIQVVNLLMAAIRDIIESDFGSIIKLNDGEVMQTSPMDLSRLRLLVHLSSYCKVATVEDQVVAFLIALGVGEPYENDNYNWFSARFSSFLYVDRIVVSADYSGYRIGSELYAGMFDVARASGIKMIACEYNIEPPNPASRVFHTGFGFKEIGTQWVSNGTKQVSLQIGETKQFI
jgi:predicted GNAT superfamily acetyltransferase